MPQNYRNQSSRPDRWRGGRHQTGSERDRYHTGGEERFSPDWEDRDEYSRGFAGDRGYSAGGYSEEFGYRRGQDRDEGHDRWIEASQGEHGDRDLGGAEFYRRGRGTSTSRWREDPGDPGGYFDTGNYIDDGGSWRGFGRDMERERMRAQQERDFGSYRQRQDGYGRSRYGSPADHGRDRYERGYEPWNRQQGSYDERSSWSYGQTAGSGSPRGGYGRDFGSYAGTQSFRGRGPRGYRRSDERLKEMICERLTDDPAIDASDVSIEVNDQCVKLTGTVDDRSTKYEIEELIESFGGVKDIDNQLRVRRWNSSQDPQEAGGRNDWEAGSVGASGTSRTETVSPATSSTGSSGTPTGRKS